MAWLAKVRWRGWRIRVGARGGICCTEVNAGEVHGGAGAGAGARDGA